GVLEQDLVHRVARDVERLVWPRPAGAKEEGVLVAALLVVKGHAELRLEAVRADAIEHAQALELQHAGRQERTADEKWREALATAHTDAQRAARQAREVRGDARAAGPAADHDDVEAGALVPHGGISAQPDERARTRHCVGRDARRVNSIDGVR